MTSHRILFTAGASLLVIAILLALLTLGRTPAAAAQIDAEPVITDAAQSEPATSDTGTSGTADSVAATEPAEAISPTEPARVLVVGDSITQSAQVEITTAIEAGGSQIQMLSWGGTAPCDWIGPVTDTVADFDPDIVLIEFAGNDLTPCIADTPRGSDGYLARYTEDAQTLTAAAAAGGATVRWTSVPIIDHADHEAVAVELNDLYRTLSDSGQLTPLRPALTVAGAFGYEDRCRGETECGDAPAFSTVPIRSFDGLHLARAGSARMASVYAQVVHSLTR
ncbi:MAG: SGNH/GDSL hydrolase family protein [Acidimicrobiales bacterium]